MSENRFLSLLAERCLVSDGATGSNLQQQGLTIGEPGEKWVLENPAGVLNLHTEFFEAGADILLTCTFGASEFLLEQHHLLTQQEKIVTRAVTLAKEAAAEKDLLIAGSVGPLGKLMLPYGELSKDDVYRAYARLIGLLALNSVDFILIETQYDLAEAMIAIQAAHDTCDLPIVCSFSFDRGTRTMMGVTPEQFTDTIGGLNVAMLGINCGKSLEQNLTILDVVTSRTDLPIWFKPNAGIPAINEKGEAIYSVDSAMMGDMARRALSSGARVIGGCCGTTATLLGSIAKTVKSQ